MVEEMVMNPKYDGYRAGRIEIRDRKEENRDACYEARFLIPEEFMDAFRDIWDLKESDKMPYIHWEFPKKVRASEYSS